MPRTLLALVLLWAALYLPGLGQSDILSTNEANRAMAAREMLARGDWIVPTLVGEPYLNKPPAYYWQAMLCYRVFGDHAAGARLPAALAALATALAAFGCFHRQGRAQAGAFAAMLCLATPLLILQGTEAELDMGLILWIFLTQLCMLQALQQRPITYSLLAYLFLALATLTKGPVAWAFFLPMLLLQVAFLYRDRMVPGRRLAVGHLLGLALCIAVCLPWCYAVVHRLGWDYTWMILKRESLQRTVKASKINSDPFWFYVPRFLVGSLPWTPLLWLLFTQAPRDAREERSRAYLGLCSLAQLGLFSLFAGKETQYLMPILPPMAVVVAYTLDSETRQPSSRVPAWIGRFCLAGVALVALGSVIVGLVPNPYGRLASRMAAASLLVVGAFLWAWKRRGRLQWWHAPLGLLFLATVFMGFVRAPLRNQYASVRPAMTAVLAELPDDAPVVVYRHGESQLYYYLHGRARPARDAGQLHVGDYVLYRASAQAQLASLRLEPILQVSEKPGADASGKYRLQLARIVDASPP